MTQKQARDELAGMLPQLPPLACAGCGHDRSEHRDNPHAAPCDLCACGCFRLPEPK
jgi:hypothetical protein